MYNAPHICIYIVQYIHPVPHEAQIQVEEDVVCTYIHRGVQAQVRRQQSDLRVQHTICTSVCMYSTEYHYHFYYSLQVTWYSDSFMVYSSREFESGSLAIFDFLSPISLARLHGSQLKVKSECRIISIRLPFWTS